MIVIVDYDMGNVGSLQNMIKKAGGEAVISGRREDVSGADKLVLPGVGSFDQAVTRLQELGLFEVLNSKVAGDGVPILAICLGAQLVTENSEEGSLPGFGWVKGKTVRFRFPAGDELKIPHMGWSEICVKKDHPVLRGMEGPAWFYFVHSYYLVCNHADDILATAEYGHEFCAAVQHENIIATQFHPEKSHKYGLKLISNFVTL